MTELDYEKTDVQQDQIGVYHQPPRTELEQPLLLVWPNPVVDQWAAEIGDDGAATVVCHEWLVEVTDADDETEVEKRAEPVEPDDEIPGYVADALLDYEGNYGPVSEVVNPVSDDGADDESDDGQLDFSQVGQ